MDKKKPETINVEYKRSNEFKFFPVTGAYGGPSPQGEIVCNFFIEHHHHPEQLKLLIDTNTRKVTEERPDLPGGKKMIRELQVGLVMRPDIARSIGEWLIKEADKVIFDSPPKDKQV